MVRNKILCIHLFWVLWEQILSTRRPSLSVQYSPHYLVDRTTESAEVHVILLVRVLSTHPVPTVFPTPVVLRPGQTEGTPPLVLDRRLLPDLRPLSSTSSVVLPS